ncbi:CBL-interacting protein kinase 29 [Ananas comosus]|uniref:non-specific serine/threonine protein kinase n=1 Tax=Ananas comosus TaxID=4615 RepID=A0A199WA57_ANACO|nr:CBL-interacting protein kinase 29 [Ananas comosus]
MTTQAPVPAPDYGCGAGKVVLGRYELGRVLGRGATAKVYLARDLSSGLSVALKSIPKSRPQGGGGGGGDGDGGASPAAILREISSLRRLRHPHVARLHGVLASRSRIYLALELARGGNLLSRLESRGPGPGPGGEQQQQEELARRYFRQLISAVGYAHSRGVFHRDLKPENLLLDERGDLKVTDFGLSAQTAHLRPDDGLLHTICGTPAYVAPEILSKQGYDGAKVDIWSCGVVLFALNAGYLPFNHPNLITMYKKICRAQYRCPKWTSPDLRHLLSRILDPDPHTRITLDGIVAHPWFARGLDVGRWTAVMRLGDGDDDDDDGDGKDQMDRDGRALNAFDIISLAPGCDLSGLFGAGRDRDRFVWAGPAEPVLDRAEQVARAEGWRARRLGKKGLGGVLLQGQNGNFVARVEVYQIAPGTSMVVVVTGDGVKDRRFWEERLESSLKNQTVRAQPECPVQNSTKPLPYGTEM